MNLLKHFICLTLLLPFTTTMFLAEVLFIGLAYRAPGFLDAIWEASLEWPMAVYGVCIALWLFASLPFILL